MNRATHEEWSHLPDVLGRLTGAAHRLNHVRQWMQFLADQTDHELVVVGVEAMAGEADVVGEIGVSITLSDHRVFAQDRALLTTFELLERADPPKRVPDRPGPLGIGHGLDGPI